MVYNYIIASALIAWAIAQIIKTILHSFKFKDFNAQRLVGAGGMPSSHTSLVIASLVCVGRSTGIGSTEFGIMFILSAVVIYDAMGVRRAAGLHAKELNRMKRIFLDLKNSTPFKDIWEHWNNENKEISESKEFQEYLGHTPLEVTAGALLGVIVALLMPMK